ncbi:MAG: PhoH family protein [Leptolyngbyaceae bacterium]|nr:PhoH family protein [Leptolyngbyaceae bacterium]
MQKRRQTVGKFPKPKTPGQEEYWDAIQRSTVTIGVGPAGSGKTFLAVAAAIHALKTEQVRTLCFCRPAVEAVERLGYLPGDVTAKLAPYMRPLYDAIDDTLGTAAAEKLLGDRMIEVCALAHMRGRTLKDAFIVLDEAQNTTPEQMKMFLTRIGMGSRAVVVGDPNQSDIRGPNGLADIVELLEGGVEGVSVCHLTAVDIQRHPVVQRVVYAYEARALLAQGPELRAQNL